MRIAHTPFAGYLFAGTIDAESAEGEGLATPVADGRRTVFTTGSSSANMSANDDASRITRGYGTCGAAVAVINTEAIIGKLLEPYPALCRARVFGVPNEVLWDMDIAVAAGVTLAVEKITPAGAQATATATLVGEAIAHKVFGIAKTLLSATAIPQADFAVEANGVKTVDASSVVTVGAAAAVNTIAYTYATNPSNTTSAGIAEAVRIRQVKGAANCIVSAIPAKTQFHHGTSVKPALAKATATITTIHGRTAVFTPVAAIATVAPIPNMNVGVKAVTQGRATCQSAFEKYRITSGACAANAATQARGRIIVQAAGVATAGIAVATGYNRVNSYEHAPLARTIVITAEDHEIPLAAENHEITVI